MVQNWTILPTVQTQNSINPGSTCFSSTNILSIGKSCWIYHQNIFQILPFFTFLTATTLVKAIIVSCLDSWRNLFPGLPWPTTVHSQHSSQIASFNNVMSLNSLTVFEHSTVLHYEQEPHSHNGPQCLTWSGPPLRSSSWLYLPSPALANPLGPQGPSVSNILSTLLPWVSRAAPPPWGVLLSKSTHLKYVL